MYVLIGADIASGPVWMEYIGFLKILPVCIFTFHFSYIQSAINFFTENILYSDKDFFFF